MPVPMPLGAIEGFNNYLAMNNMLDNKLIFIDIDIVQMEKVHISISIAKVQLATTKQLKRNE